MRFSITLSFFLSGAAALSFQVIWVRLMSLVFGATSLAMGTVTAAFMAGLALGATLGGKYAGRLKRPVVSYALLEVLVVVSALVLYQVLHMLPALHSFLWQLWGEQFFLFGLVRFLICFALLLPPTVCMGATLPILAVAMARGQSQAAKPVGYLYAANTFGAVAGTLVTGFALMPALGMAATNWTASAMAMLAAGIAYVQRNFGCKVAEEGGVPCGAEDHPLPQTDLPDDGHDLPGALDDEEDLDNTDSLWAELFPPRERIPIGRERTSLLALFGGLGICSMVFQILWARSLAIVNGSSVYSFSIVLAVVLMGEALGAAVVARMMPKICRPVRVFALTILGVGLLAALGFWGLDRLPMLFLSAIRGMEEPGVLSILLLNTGLSALVVFPSSLAGGAAFPLMVRILTGKVQDDGTRGSEVGKAYAINTLGSILGAGAGAFWVLPRLGLGQGMRLASLFLVLLAVLLAVLSGRLALDTEAKRAARPLALVFVAFALLVILGPSLKPTRLASGMFRVALARNIYKSDDFEDTATLLYYKDGHNATITVELRGEEMYSLKANGKPEASSHSDMPTQVLVGLLPLLLHENPEDTALVGLGSGVTAGSMLAVDEVRKLTVAELEMGMVEAARYFAHLNRHVLFEPRMEVRLTDGRNWLASTAGTFDVIVSEPSNPWITGVSNLFTLEHFEAASQRLKEGGIFCQWLQTYEMSPRNVRSILATFQSVFPHVKIFLSKAKGADLILMGTTSPLDIDLAKIRERIEASTEIQDELVKARVEAIEDLAALLFMVDDEVIEMAQGAPINTDDNALVEFSAPYDLIRSRQYYQWLGEFYYSEMETGNPLKHIEGIPESGQKRAEVLGSLALGLIRAGRPGLVPEAVRLAEEAGGHPDAKLASRVMETVGRKVQNVDVAIPPQAPKAVFEMVFHVADGHYQLAVKALYDLHPSIRKREYSRFVLGYLLHQAEMFKEAVDTLNALGDSSPKFVENNPLVHLYLGRSLYELTRYNEALDEIAAYLDAVDWAEDPKELTTIVFGRLLERTDES